MCTSPTRVWHRETTQTEVNNKMVMANIVVDATSGESRG